MNLREQILKASKKPRVLVPVEVPEWGEEDGKPLTVYVKRMTGLDRDKFEERMLKGIRLDYRASILAFSVCDSEGNSLFSAADYDTLGTFDAVAIERIIEVANDINALKKEDMNSLGEDLPTGI